MALAYLFSMVLGREKEIWSTLALAALVVLALDPHALFRALILGERQGITPELREPFNRAGLGHILAVSGLHIGLVGWLAFYLIKGVLSRSYRLALQTDIRKLAAAITCLPVVAYDDYGTRLPLFHGIGT